MAIFGFMGALWLLSNTTCGLQMLGRDGFTPDTTLAEVVSKHFYEAATVLGLIQDPTILTKRNKLKDRLEALGAAKRKLPM